MTGGYFAESDFVDGKMTGKIKYYAKLQDEKNGRCFYGNNEEYGWDSVNKSRRYLDVFK